MGSQEPSQIQGPAGETVQDQLTPCFKLAYATVVAITLLALALNVLLALVGGDSDQVRNAAEACSTTYKMGFGAIVGLISQKQE